MAQETMTVKQRQRIARFLMAKGLLENGCREVLQELLSQSEVIPEL
jgi:hypothetical protein